MKPRPQAWSNETVTKVRDIIKERGSLTPEERTYFMNLEGKSMRSIANLEYGISQELKGGR